MDELFSPRTMRFWFDGVLSEWVAIEQYLALKRDRERLIAELERIVAMDNGSELSGEWMADAARKALARPADSAEAVAICDLKEQR